MKKTSNALLLSFIIIGMFILSITLTSCKKDNGEIVTKEGETTYITNLKKSPEKVDANTAVYALAGNLKYNHTYQIDIQGNVNAKKGFIHYEQGIKNLIIKNGNESYTSSISNSIIKSEHQAFFKEDKVAYRNALLGELTVTTLENYKEVFGVIPTSNLLGYIFNDTTITYSEKLESDNDGEYKYRYVLNHDATTYMARQTKELGNLNNLPQYTNLEMIITMSEDYQPVSIVVNSTYNMSIAILGDFTCKQSLSYTFSKINQAVSIPNTIEFNQVIGSTPTIIHPSDIETDTTLADVIDALVSLDMKMGIIAKGDVELNLMGMTMLIPISLELKVNGNDLNMENAIQFSISTNILGSEVQLFFINDNHLYLAIGEEKIKIELSENIVSNTNPVASLEKILTVTKMEDGIYNLSLNIDVINEVMTKFGIEFEKIEVILNVINERASTVELNVSSSIIDFCGEFALAEKKVTITEDFSLYTKTLDEFINKCFNVLEKLNVVGKDLLSTFTKLFLGGLEVDASLYLNANDSSGNPILAELSIPILIQTNFNNGFSLNIGIDISDNTTYEMVKMILGLMLTDFSTGEMKLTNIATIDRILTDSDADVTNDIVYLELVASNNQLILNGYSRPDDNNERKLIETDNLILDSSFISIEKIVHTIIDFVATDKFMVDGDNVTIDLLDVIGPIFTNFIEGLDDIAKLFLPSYIPTTITKAEMTIYTQVDGTRMLSFIVMGPFEGKQINILTIDIVL